MRALRHSSAVPPRHRRGEVAFELIVLCAGLLLVVPGLAVLATGQIGPASQALGRRLGCWVADGSACREVGSAGFGQGRALTESDVGNSRGESDRVTRVVQASENALPSTATNPQQGDGSLAKESWGRTFDRHVMEFYNAVRQRRPDGTREWRPEHAARAWETFKLRRQFDHALNARPKTPWERGAIAEVRRRVDGIVAAVENADATVWERALVTAVERYTTRLPDGRIGIEYGAAGDDALSAIASLPSEQAAKAALSRAARDALEQVQCDTNTETCGQIQTAAALTAMGLLLEYSPLGRAVRTPPDGSAGPSFTGRPVRRPRSTVHRYTAPPGHARGIRHARRVIDATPHDGPVPDHINRLALQNPKFRKAFPKLAAELDALPTQGALDLAYHYLDAVDPGSRVISMFRAVRNHGGVNGRFVTTFDRYGIRAVNALISNQIAILGLTTTPRWVHGSRFQIGEFTEHDRTHGNGVLIAAGSALDFDRRYEPLRSTMDPSDQYLFDLAYFFDRHEQPSALAEWSTLAALLSFESGTDLFERFKKSVHRHTNVRIRYEDGRVRAEIGSVPMAGYYPNPAELLNPRDLRGALPVEVLDRLTGDRDHDIGVVTEMLEDAFSLYYTEMLEHVAEARGIALPR